MLRKSILLFAERIVLLPKNRRKCICISVFIIIQCIAVFVGSGTIRYCLWAPSPQKSDFDNLVRIMYLYDYKACGYQLRKVASIQNRKLSNETYKFHVLPIQWMPATMAVATRLAARTRTYIEISIGLHTLWMMSAMAMWMAVKIWSSNHNVLKAVIGVFFYMSISMVIFDCSMGIVYIAHIKQSLSKGMILRYSGWSVELQLLNYEDFAGWIPMAAFACWLRGIIIFGANLYCLKAIQYIRLQMHKREVRRKLMCEGNLPIPEPRNIQLNDVRTLYFRTGEFNPHFDPF